MERNEYEIAWIDPIMPAIRKTPEWEEMIARTGGYSKHHVTLGSSVDTFHSNLILRVQATYHTRELPQVVGAVYLKEMPSCCAILLVHNWLAGYGVGALSLLASHIARVNHYTKVQTNLTPSNQKPIFDYWKTALKADVMQDFTSIRTEKRIVMLCAESESLG